MKKNKIRNDIILIAAVILIAAIALTFLIIANMGGMTAVVYVDGELFGKYSLAVDRQIDIPSSNGTNVLIIKDGKANMVYATCPDLVCVDHAPISETMEQIICLPNKVAVEIE